MESRPFYFKSVDLQRDLIGFRGAEISFENGTAVNGRTNSRK